MGGQLIGAHGDRGYIRSCLRPAGCRSAVAVRATTLLNRLLDLPGISVTDAAWHGRQLVVDVRLRAHRLACPLCGYTTRAGYDSRVVPSWWRSMDYGPHEVIVRGLLRRLECPEHGVRVQAVPFARHRAQFTRDFEDVTAF